MCGKEGIRVSHVAEFSLLIYLLEGYTCSRITVKVVGEFLVFCPIV